MKNLLDVTSQGVISISTMLVEFLGLKTIGKIHACADAFHRLVLLDMHFRSWVFPLWQFILFSIVSIAIGRELERRIPMGRKRVLNDFVKMLGAKKILSATAITQQNEKKISATVEIDIGLYVLNLATESAGQPKASEQHHFKSLGDFFRFLENDTILRAGDFK